MRQFRDTRYEIRGNGGAGHGFDSDLASRISQRAAALSLLLGVLLMAPAMAAAQVAIDPTRPPADAGVAEAGARDAGGGILLQSVLISPTMKAAIINGVMVKLGEKYGDAVLTKVAENEVVLKSGGASQVLRLHPEVEKREIEQAKEKGAARRGKAREGARPTATRDAPVR